MLHEQVRGQVERLIPLYRVGDQASCILTAFDALCRESLALELDDCTPERSRINADGTPFQFALALAGDTAAPLQFLSEAGRPGCAASERLRASYVTLMSLSRTCGVVEQANRLIPVLRDLVPERDPRVVADASGHFWFALGFGPGRTPSLTVYVNGHVGSETERWRRLGHFADVFGSPEHLRTLEAASRPALSPLGMAVTLNAGAPVSGRVYLHAFGVQLPLYRALFLHGKPSTDRAEAFEEFTRFVLGPDARFPTRSAVFSIECSDTHAAGVKFEICAHCAFAHDAEAVDRISAWLTASGLDGQVYPKTLSALMRGRTPSAVGRPSLHAYVGVGARGAGRYASIYLNPSSALATA